MTISWKLYWILVAATLTLYFVMVFWSLPLIREAAGGLVPFDMRPTGYSFEEAQAFLTGLSGDGAKFYRATQHKLDTAYPAMLAAVLMIGLWGLSRTWPTWVRRILLVFPFVGSLADYLENSAVAGMLDAGSDLVSVDMVAASSRWTVLKSGATTIGMVALLGLLLMALFRKLSHGKSV